MRLRAPAGKKPGLDGVADELIRSRWLCSPKVALSRLKTWSALGATKGGRQAGRVHGAGRVSTHEPHKRVACTGAPRAHALVGPPSLDVVHKHVVAKHVAVQIRAVERGGRGLGLVQLPGLFEGAGLAGVDDHQACPTCMCVCVCARARPR